MWRGKQRIQGLGTLGAIEYERTFQNAIRKIKIDENKNMCNRF
jgi:hypothetical protein